MVSPANTNNPGFLPAPCGLLVDSYCITPLTSQLIRSFCEQFVYLMLLILTPTAPGPTSVTWHVTVLRNCWTTDGKAFFFRIFLPGPTLNFAWSLSGIVSLAPEGRVQHQDFTVLVFNVPPKGISWARLIFFPVLSLLPLFFINMGWQIDLTFGCEVRVVTCYLTFC